jgi:beta-barrel assembly-enhancing protease
MRLNICRTGNIDQSDSARSKDRVYHMFDQEKMMIRGASRVTTKFMVVLSFFCWLSVGALAAATAPPNFDEETKLGKEAADEVAKESKFIDDAALVARVDTIGAAIAKVATEMEVPARYGKSAVAKFNYAFKIIDDKDVNAFSLPGGFVYVNKGLLDYAQTDDELAGVMAHEIVHVAHHHGIQLMKSQQKAMLGLAAAVLGGAALGAKGNDLGYLAQIGNMIAMAKMSSYGQKAEIDSDRTAVAYLSQTPYNAVGMLTFMQRLARDEIRKPEVIYGIFATHPPSYLRAQEITDELNIRGIPINTRMVTTYMRVHVKPVADSEASSVWIADTEVIRLADSNGEKAVARAERVAKDLSNTLLAGAQIRDVKIGGGGRYIVISNEVLIAPTEDDARIAGVTVPQVATASIGAIKKALLKELLEQRY